MIAFVGRVGLTAAPTGHGEPIYVVRADGSGLRNLTPKPVGTYAAPAWSPDGRKLAFVSDREGNSEVYVMNADGSGQRSLTRNPAYDADPAWSHDGRIAFVSNRDGNYGVYVMNADGADRGGWRNTAPNATGRNERLPAESSIRSEDRPLHLRELLSLEVSKTLA